MKNIKNTLTLLFVSIFLILNLAAQNYNYASHNEKNEPKNEFKQAINICPIAPLFGIYAVNYEYLITPKNGVVARLEYEDVPKSYTDASIESSGMAYSINYRRHLSEGLNSLFVGAYTRYREYEGNGEIEQTTFDFSLSSWTFGLNGGKRWVWNSGFNITTSLGYGISIEERIASPSNNLIESSLDELEKDYDFMSPFYGELSIGFAF